MTSPNWNIILTLLEWLIFFITALGCLTIGFLACFFIWNFFKGLFKKKK